MTTRSGLGKRGRGGTSRSGEGQGGALVGFMRGFGAAAGLRADESDATAEGFEKSD